MKRDTSVAMFALIGGVMVGLFSMTLGGGINGCMNCGHFYGFPFTSYWRGTFPNSGASEVVWAGLAGNILVSAFALSLLLNVIMPKDAEPAKPHRLCGRCGYDLFGSESSTCPECGAEK